MPERGRGSLLIRSGHVATMDDELGELPGGFVTVRDGAIGEVGPGSRCPEPGSFDRTVDASGCVVMPGLVNTHQHCWYTLFRGLGEGLALEAWLERMLFPLSRRMAAADLVLATRLGCLEMLATGTTCAFEHSVISTDTETTLAVARAARDVGVRMVIGKELRADLPSSLEDAGAILADGGAHAGLVIETAQHWLARGATTDGLIVAGAELARRHGVPVSDHVATGSRQGYSRQVAAAGMTDVGVLQRLEVLDEHWLLVHGIWLDDADGELIAASGATVVDTPTSHAARAGGVTPCARLHVQGARLALGTDGPMVDASVDMLEQAKSFLGEQRQSTLDASAFDARSALRMATIHAARAVGLDHEIGSLAAGKRADIAIFDLSGPHIGVVHDPLVSLVGAGRGADARWVLVEGRALVDDGQLLTGDDLREIRDEARSRAERHAGAVGLPLPAALGGSAPPASGRRPGQV
ncbi:MAG: amidohydrolase family protein [Acidimicrobiales bacterium]